MRQAAALLLALFVPGSAAAQASCHGLAGLAGRYAPAGEPATSVVYVTFQHGTLVIRPIEWQGGAPYAADGPDSLHMAGHADRFRSTFERDADGCGRALTTAGYGYEGVLRRVPDSEVLPIERLYTGDAAAASRELVTALPLGRVVAIARALLRWPTHVTRALTFLGAAAARHPGSAELQALRGDAHVAAGDREAARASYRSALTADRRSTPAAMGLRMLGDPAAPVASGEGWRSPISTAALFAPPTRAEIATVERAWTRRDLAPRDVQLIRRDTIEFEGAPAEVRTWSHVVHGSRHYGIVIVPHGVRNAPIVAEARGVSPSFPPLQVPGSLTSPEVLGADARRTIIVSPSYRGEGLVIGADTLRSSGDRSDAWDGATDDFLVFLAVAKRVTPEADTSRVCAFGRSRGGTVVLLASIREPSLDCTVAWAAPTEWLQLMGTGGWRQRELVEEGLRQRSRPGNVGGQFIDYFLSRALAGTRDLAGTRRHIIASSPIHFAGRLGPTQVHWATEDGAVPIGNGREFVTAAGDHAATCLDVHVHEGAGHDQDRIEAPRQSRAFLAAYLFRGAPALPSCRTRQRGASR